jgi:ABC-type branched-subunit amino acid transport system ATPase component
VVSVSGSRIVSLDGVWFDVAPDSILGLIGPNGAGKTTLFNCVSRLYTPTLGDDAAAPRGLQPHAQRGVSVPSRCQVGNLTTF